MSVGPSKEADELLRKTSTQNQGSGLALDSKGDLSAHLDAPIAATSGQPLDLDMHLIDEDPDQPRTKDNPGFSDASLAELAASVSLRGVKTPISVRDNPKSPGRYLINHGARRYRASRLAHRSTIKGFIDNDYNEADQIVENLQRNELTAREIANYIGRELAKGIKKNAIAKIISKSPAFVSQHVTLLDLPDAIAEVFNSGRTRDVTVINELVTAHKKKPQDVANWLADQGQEITRGSVKMFREFLDSKEDEDNDQPGEINPDGELNEANDTGSVNDVEDNERAEEAIQKVPDAQNLKKAIIQVQHDGRPARLILTRRPLADGFAWLKYDDSGQEIEAELKGVTLVALLAG